MPPSSPRVTPAAAAERVPVLIAGGQCLDRDASSTAAELAEGAAMAALAAAPGLAPVVDRLTVIAMLSPAPPAPAGYLADRLRLTPAARESTTVGGDSPALAVIRAAADIAAGRLRAALVVGAEASWSPRERPRPPGEAAADRPADTVVGVDRSGVSDAERAVKLVLPAHIYPMLASARTPADPPAQRAAAGRLLAPFTEVAARHPYAWFPQARSAAEIATPTPANRITAEPYTKLMNAFPAVSQGAAVLVCSLAEARRAGLADAAIFLWSGASAADVWFPVSRPQPGRAPAASLTIHAALAAAAAPPGAVRLLDLYSCFPVAVQAGVDAIAGQPAVDPAAPRTVTGGLPYFGGPGNNYLTHALATMADCLRQRRGLGLLTAVGWYLTKHAALVVGTDPPPAGFRVADTSAAQQRIAATARPIAEDPAGPATVVAATTVYDRHDGSVRRVFGYLELADGSRTAATAAAADAPACAGRSLVGARVRVAGSPPTFRVEALPGG